MTHDEHPGAPTHPRGDANVSVPQRDVVRLVVGRIGRPHGIRGEVAVDVRTDDPERRFAPGAMLATDPPQVGPLAVVQARRHSGGWLLQFAGVVDRTGAEALRGTLLLTEGRSDERPEDPAAFYDHQLVGLRVETADGRLVGSVTQMLHLPGQDVVLVRAGGGETLVPFVEAIVPVVDLDGGRMVVNPPAGLLDEPAQE